MLLHQGVVPDTNLAAALGCAIEWDEANACFRPVTSATHLIFPSRSGGTSARTARSSGDRACRGIAAAGASRQRFDVFTSRAGDEFGTGSGGDEFGPSGGGGDARTVGS